MKTRKTSECSADIAAAAETTEKVKKECPVKKLFNKISNSEKGKLVFEKLKLSAFYIVIVMLWEVIVHLLTFGWLQQESLYMLAFCVPFGCLLAFIRSLFGNTAGKIVNQVIMVLLALLYCSQYIYTCVFGSFFSVFQIGMGGDAIAGFWKETVSTVEEHIPQLVLILLPLVLYELFFFLYKKPVTRLKLKPVLVNIAIIALLHGICLLSLNVDGKNYYSFKDIYFSNSTSTDRSVEILGVATTLRLETQHMIFGTSDNQLGIVEVDMPKTGTEDNEHAATEVDTELSDDQLNVISEIDFDYLNTLNNQNAISTLNNYFSEQTGTAKNEYTGLFEGYNLIVMCCESFHPAVISEELTPTLYRLSHEGIIFNNFYNCYLNNTTNGEYTLCMGNFPDLSRSKSNGSFHNSRNNYLPYCLGNEFNSIGVKSYGYHNYLGTYYDRENTHPNMGYECKFAEAGMTFTTNWPASDFEMFEQSVDDYINNDRFHAYYMTFSGHYKYSFNINPMSARNQYKVSDLDYSTPVKAYIACTLELEKGLNYLVNRLEKAGIADKTVIVITNDHFPYGLTDEEFTELSGIEVNSNFDKCKSAFICWNPGLEENIVCDEYCCSVDILPTVLNLFGLEYDSRLLAGTDVFSDSTHMAILSDQSFITDIVRFDNSTGEVTYLVDTNDYTEEYLETYLDAMINTVKNRMTVSAAVLNYDYYNYVYENCGLKPIEETESDTESDTETEDETLTTDTEQQN